MEDWEKKQTEKNRTQAGLKFGGFIALVGLFTGTPMLILGGILVFIINHFTYDMDS